MTPPPTFQKADNAQKADRGILLANIAPTASAHEHHEPSGSMAAEHLPMVKVHLEPIAIAFDILSLLARFFGVSLLSSASSGAYVVSGAQANVALFLQDLMVMMHHQAAAQQDIDHVDVRTVLHTLPSHHEIQFPAWSHVKGGGVSFVVLQSLAGEFDEKAVWMPALRFPLLTQTVDEASPGNAEHATPVIRFDPGLFLRTPPNTTGTPGLAPAPDPSLRPPVPPDSSPPPSQPPSTPPVESDGHHSHAPSNHDPTVLNAIANQNATEDAPFSFQFAANTFDDSDPGTTLTYSAILVGGGALPAWLTFDTATRTFSGTPANGDVGTIAVKVTADDSQGGTVTETFDIAVINVNDAPTVANAMADQNATESSPFSFQFAANVFADMDGDALTYSATQAGGAALPAWLSFNAATRTFSGTPAGGDVGTVTVTVTTDDSHGGTVDDTFDIYISSLGNNLPTVDNPIADQNATEDAAFNFQFAANVFSDTDGHALTYTAAQSDGSALPAWLSFNAATRTFSGTPLNANVGTLSVRVRANDGHGGTVDDFFDLAVANTNDAPTVANAIADQNATEDAAFSFQFASNVFADVDVGATLTYTATKGDGTALPAWLSFNAATRTFSGTPANGDVGTLTVKVTADDGNGGTVFDTFDIAVANTNDAPTVTNAISDQSATEDAAFNFQFAANVFADVDVGDTFTYTATKGDGTALPAWLSFNAATRTFSGTPLNANVGTLTIKLVADDGHGSAVFDTFDITVANTNDAPTVANAVADQTAAEDTAFSFQFASNVFADVDVGDTLTYTATKGDGTALPAWLSFNAATRTFSGTPAIGDVGTLTVKVTADDSHGGTVSDTFDVVVSATNDAPTVANAIADQNATENAAFNYQFAANVFADEEGDTLTYTATKGDGTALPAWLTFNTATRTFSGTPLAANIGTLSVKVTADDSHGGTVTDTFDIAVASGGNHAPTVASTVSDTAALAAAAFNLNTSGNFSDIDAGDTLTYSATAVYVENGANALASWLSLNTTTGVFSGTPAAGNRGEILVTLTAQDSFGATISTQFYIDTDSFTATGTAGADTIAGTAGADGFHGGNGDDSISGGSSGDTLYGGSGNDTLSGGTIGDTLYGGTGNDTINGDSNADLIFGGYGNDTLAGGANAGDTVFGNEGDDLFLITGNEGLDIYDGGAGTDTILGSAGNDTIGLSVMSVAIEVIDGGGGTDIIQGSTTFDFSSVTLLNISQILGTGVADSIVGSSGNDSIDGSGGSDTLRGGLGQDTLTGSTSNERLILDQATAGNDDHITDFKTSGTDKIALSDAVFTFASGDGAKNTVALTDNTDIFDAAGFAGGSFSGGGGCTFLYDTTDGQLWYDADGQAGGGTSILIATIDNFASYVYSAGDFIGWT